MTPSESSSLFGLLIGFTVGVFIALAVIRLQDCEVCGTKRNTDD